MSLPPGMSQIATTEGRESSQPSTKHGSGRLDESAAGVGPNWMPTGPQGAGPAPAALADYELPPNQYQEITDRGTSNDWRADLELNRYKRRALHQPYAPKHRRPQHR